MQLIINSPNTPALSTNEKNSAQSDQKSAHDNNNSPIIFKVTSPLKQFPNNLKIVSPIIKKNEDNKEIEKDDDFNFALAVKNGLNSKPLKVLPCRYFYNAEGSLIFEEITELQEYYLTRCETEILNLQSNEICTQANCNQKTKLVELGSGSSTKTRILINELLKMNQGCLNYLPIDISKTILEDSAKEILLRTNPNSSNESGLVITGIAAEYQKGLAYISSSLDDGKSQNLQENMLVLFLGSSIGNFTRSEAKDFLSLIRQYMLANRDHLLIGIDIRKDKDILERAYDDSLGVTARFNLNLIKRINNELGGNLDLNNFAHRAIYRVDEGRIEMHVVSKIEQTVTILDDQKQPYQVHFDENEYIHTENSFKYNCNEINELANSSGFKLKNQWFDSKNRYSLNLFEAN